MSYIAEKMFPKTSAETPMIHDDTKGTLPAGRIAVNGEHGDPAVSTTLVSILAYDPLTDDAGQWHPVSSGWYGAFQDLTTQTAASTTVAYPITLNTTDLSNGVSIGATASQVVFAYDGVYNIQLGIQLRNTASDEHDAAIWLRKNGADIPGTTGHVTVPKRHGTTDGHTIAAWNYVLDLNAGDILELYWRAESTGLSLYTYPAGTTPVYPQAAAVFFTATEVATVIGGSGVTGGTGGDPVLGGDLSGFASNATVVGLHGQPLSSTAPTASQVLVFDGTQWAPGTPGTLDPVLGGDLAGVASDATVVAIQGEPVATTAPAVSQVLMYDGAQWAPETVTGLTPSTIRASELATVLTPIFDEDGKIVYDAAYGVLYTEIELEGV